MVLAHPKPASRPYLLFLSSSQGAFVEGTGVVFGGEGGGSGVDPARQEAPHAHQVVPCTSGETRYGVDARLLCVVPISPLR